MDRRKTKIIATLGPAVESREQVSELVEAGMDVARLNFSHGTHESHGRFARWVRESSEEHGRAIGLLQDIQGPRIRVGTFPGGTIELDQGEEVKLVPGDGEADPGEIHIEGLETAEMAPGARVVLSDGLIRLEVVRAADGGVVCRVVEGGPLSDQKGAAFPDTDFDLPPVTDKDRRDLEFGAELGVDMVAASFVATGDDIRLVAKLAGGVEVIAKIERAAAYDNLEDVLAASAGAMVARGDLGVELSLQRLPLVQKDIIRRTNSAGRISITATEMLESMTFARRPTRAEVTDVANAVLDGTDAVMLSAETAVGKFPARVVRVMDVICRDAEAHAELGMKSVAFLEKESPFPSAIARACVEAATDLDLPVIVAFTETGTTARLISKYRPAAGIVAFTALPGTYNRMALYWGVTPLRFERLDSTDEMIQAAESRLVEMGLVQPGERVAMVAGVPPNQRSATNLLKLHKVGEVARGVPGRAGR